MNLGIWHILAIVVLVPVVTNVVAFAMSYLGYLPLSAVVQTTRAVAAAETVMAAIFGAHAHAGFWQSRTVPPDIHLWITGLAGWLFGCVLLLAMGLISRYN